MHRLSLLITILTLLLVSVDTHAQFSRVSGDGGLGNTDKMDGGQAWGDLNNDGYPDVIFHTGTTGNNYDAKLFINDGPPNFNFTDKTSELIAGFNDALAYGRQVLIVDFNNDGLNDVMRSGGGSERIEIYFNNGASNNYSFGDGSGQPDVEITTMPDGQQHNLEGVGAIDWNQDGWLDLIIDNDAGGNDIYENDKDGTFSYIYPGTSAGQTGFPASHTGDGDYLTVADVNNDGYVDFYGRKTAVSNYWRFDPSIGQFVTQANPNIVSKESDKGGTMFCDFDNDGDLDLFWTSHGQNQVWRYDGKDGSGDDIWTATGLPGSSVSGITNIDGCDCGDVDNDGDLDIVMGTISGASYLLKNKLVQTGSLDFDTLHINTNANTEGLVLTDYDNDGDLDLYFCVNNASNQLYENTTIDNVSDPKNFFYINALFDNSDGAGNGVENSFRNAIGANIILTNCTGFASGMRQVNGAKGHGSQHQTKVHFGLDPTEEYLVNVYYVFKNGTRKIIRRLVTPANETNQEITIKDTDSEYFLGCSDSDFDGVNDAIDLDDDNDGIPDVVEVCGYGQSDFSCLDAILYDSNGDGLDPTDDADGDGVPNYIDASDPAIFHSSCTDTNSDGYCDTPNAFFDNDSDGIPDYQDLDSDNDGIPDLVEVGGTDADGNGRVDLMADVDLDGIPDSADADDASCIIGDGDAPPDGICDDAQGGTDTDLDGIQDADDPEADGNGWVDVYDDFGAGSGTQLAINDTDGDGLPDYLDLDADGDGIPDLIEAGGVDSDGNGIVDDLTDTDGDGYADTNDPADDGPTTGGGITGNPIYVTGPESGDGTPTYPCSACDIDGDGFPNHIDLDADNDGILDIIEVGGLDPNNDGMAEGTPGPDGYSNSLNPDDGGTPYFVTQSDDAGDADLRPEYSDNSGTGDSDGDDVPDYLDVDSDNDGIYDNYEAQATNSYISPTGNDQDGDGIDDAYDDDFGANTANGLTPNNHDTTDQPDYLDNDSDNDNIPDQQEAWDDMYDGDATEDNVSGCDGFDNDGDGLVDCFDIDDNDANIYQWQGDAAEDVNGSNSGTVFSDDLNTLLPENGGNDITEPDYRDQLNDCVTPISYYAITENGGYGTNYEFDGSKHSNGANTQIVRATVYCEPDASGYYYFYNPLEPDNYLFAIKDGAGSPNTLSIYDLVDFIEIKVEPTPTNRHKIGASEATLVMERDWRVEFKQSPVPGSTFDIKFYFDPQEMIDLDAAADAVESAATGAVRNFFWFKKTNGVENVDITESGVSGMTNITAKDLDGIDTENTGNTDGIPGSVGNAKNYVEFSGLTSFSGGTAGIKITYTALPLDLLQFSGRADGCNVELNWTTDNEENFSRFEVENSSDLNEKFKIVETVLARGGQFKQTYNLTVKHTADKNYFRLKMVDKDGTYKYSEIEVVETKCNQTMGLIDVYPNPLELSYNVVNLKLYSPVESMKVSINDSTGKILRQLEISIEKGWNTVRLDVSALEAGLYFISTEIGGRRDTKHIVRIRE